MVPRRAMGRSQGPGPEAGECNGGLLQTAAERLCTLRKSPPSHLAPFSFAQVMRQVFSDPAEAKKRGRAARERMVSQYSPEAVAVKVMDEVNRVKDKIRWA